MHPENLLENRQFRGFVKLTLLNTGNSTSATQQFALNTKAVLQDSSLSVVIIARLVGHWSGFFRWCWVNDDRLVMIEGGGAKQP